MSAATYRITPQRLRGTADNLSPSGSYWVCGVLKDAADEIDRLREEIARLEHQLATADAALAEISRITSQTHTGQPRAHTALSLIAGVARRGRG